MSRGGRTKARARREDPKPSRRQENLKATSECVQAAHRRAQEYFLSMIEGPVEPQVFVAKAKYINPQVYNDVVVERAVTGLCGYPLCSNTFTDTYGSRSYVIRNNVVYDITERRNFCSNVCYEASQLVHQQVLTLPLYLRDTEDADIKDICLPNLTKLKGSHGKVVDITGGVGNIKIDKDEKPQRRTAFMSVDEIARESLVNLSENDADKSAPDKNDHNSDCSVKEKEISNCESKEDTKEEEATVNPLTDVLYVESVMRQWVSFDSLRVILGDQYVRGMLEHCGRSWDNYDTTSGLRLSVEAKAKYIAICRKLEQDERREEEEDILDRQSGKQTEARKPLPDYAQLQRDVKKQQLKVVSFFGGNELYEEEKDQLDTIPEEKEESQPNTKRTFKVNFKKQSNNSDAGESTLPLIDSYSQDAWRQNIVIEKVTTYLQQMLEMTTLSVQEIQKLLTPMVATFHLSASNISFQPKQWRIVTLILLKLLSVRYQTIQDALRTEEGLSMQMSILSASSLDLGYGDRVISYLTEIHHILSKDFTDENTEDPESRNGTPQNADITQQTCPRGDSGVSRVNGSINSLEAQGLTQDMAQIKIIDNSVD
ncbi:putative RNA polymerase II subunit B1 CTD phosphatase rpap2 isoform X1 [Portunus trituberculatus]|uniref:putative RNA polymerase II subunit B1 CTD phosphatase rpap2 isoform X1 n=2 Tax=Portunus trituberculatus TaxID=210409 RepID=UPI001E1CF659|nr:putative RNA polymerase II subunit B1 CTD phosphatase rpap2 isoform X1 [Portunus trituberculatus]